MLFLTTSTMQKKNYLKKFVLKEWACLLNGLSIYPIK